MRGHVLQWDAMYVLDIFPGGEAAQVERSLFQLGKHGWPDRCANVACDARDLPRSHPASGLRRQPELCQQAAGVLIRMAVQ